MDAACRDLCSLSKSTVVAFLGGMEEALPIFHLLCAVRQCCRHILVFNALSCRLFSTDKVLYVDNRFL